MNKKTGLRLGASRSFAWALFDWFLKGFALLNPPGLLALDLANLLGLIESGGLRPPATPARALPLDPVWSRPTHHRKELAVINLKQ